MRRFLIFVLAVAVMSLSVFSLVACSCKTDESPAQQDSVPIQQDPGLED